MEDGEEKMHCLICGTEICNESFIADYNIYGTIKHDNKILRTAHVICWQIRQRAVILGKSVPPNRNESIKQSPLLGMAKLCTGCQGTIPKDSSRVCLKSGGDDVYYHIGCYCNLCNTRNAFCVGSEALGEKILDAWANGTNERPVAFDMPGDPVDLQTAATVTGMKITDAIGNFPVNTIKNAYKPTGESPAHKLCLELSEMPKHRLSPLTFMHKRGLSGEDMVTLGVVREMFFIFDYTSDWRLILDKTVFPVALLVRPPIKMSFATMLYSGLDIEQFVSTSYSLEELRLLKFTIKGFYAAGGTDSHVEIMASRLHCKEEIIKEFGIKKT